MKKKSRRQSSFYDGLIGDVEVPDKFNDEKYRKRVVAALIQGLSFRVKKCKYKKYEDPTFVWIKEDLSEVFYKMGALKKVPERKAKNIRMQDINIVYSGPPVLATAVDRKRWESKSTNACFTIKTNGRRSLDVEARDVIGSIGQRTRDRWVEGFQMALYLYHYREKYRDVIDDLTVPSPLESESSNMKNFASKTDARAGSLPPLEASDADDLSSTGLKITIRDTSKPIIGTSTILTPSSREDSEMSTHMLQGRARVGSGSDPDERSFESSRELVASADCGASRRMSEADRPMWLFATDQVAAATRARVDAAKPTRRKIRRRVKDGFDLAFPALSTDDIAAYVKCLPDVPPECMLARKGPFRVWKDYDGIEQMEQLQRCIRNFNTVLRSPGVALGSHDHSKATPVTFMTAITGLRQVLQAITALIDTLVTRKSAQKHTSKTQKKLSEYLSHLFARVGNTRQFLKMLAYVAKYRSLDVSNDNSKKRKHSLEKILEIVPKIFRNIERELRRYVYSARDATSSPLDDGKKRSGGESGDGRGGRKFVASASMSRVDKFPSRSTGDIFGGGAALNKPRRHSQDALTTSPVSNTAVMVDLQRIDKTKRMLGDIKRVAENWIYMLKRVDEEEKAFTEKLMASKDDDDGMIGHTLNLSKDYDLERYALPGIHLPKDMVRLFYDYWIKNVENKAEMSFTRFMLYFPYKTQEDIVNLVQEDRSKFEKLCKARIAQGFGKQTVRYFESEADRRKYRVDCESRDGVVILVKLLGEEEKNRAALDTKLMETTMSGPGVGMVVFRRPNSKYTNGSGMYVHIHKVNEIHHSTIFAGGPVDFAGEIKVSEGIIRWLSNKSGHYKPGEEAILEMLHFLRKRGVDLTAFPFDVVKGSVPLEKLKRISTPSEVQRGRAVYWRMPSSEDLYIGIVSPSLWEPSFEGFLRKRFPRIHAGAIVARALHVSRVRDLWTQCAHSLRRQHIQNVVNRGIVAVESYEGKIIEKDQLKNELQLIPFEYVRDFAGGDEGILALAKNDDSAQLAWYYRSSRGSVLGPHKSSSVYLWIRRGKLGANVQISCDKRGPFERVGSLTTRFLNLVAIRDLLRHRDGK